ncbi:N-acetyltransferase [Tardiphaga alba]|uniref:N-acetyltransferase n=1 Tax=Tardiphaga alba TaxID=340268 RepID=A0ABX8A6W3_9BRAD|nr:GNAT family N-acetyltransferase [Tardiphaga alba]QUS39372.1 N-acetyltransferase [Tardiphaga alba]
MRYAIAPLDKQHQRSEFNSGQPDIDAWFRQRASQDERRNIARVFVATDDTNEVIGFYSLSSFTLALADLPAELSSKLPRYDAIPAALIGRLARDIRVRGQGIGELLLADAIHRILGAARSLAVFAIIVDAKDAPAAAFYETFGFHAFPATPHRLFLLASSAAAALQKA